MAELVAVALLAAVEAGGGAGAQVVQLFAGGSSTGFAAGASAVAAA